MATIKLRHPEGNGTVEVAAEDAERYTSQGWVETPKPAPKSDK